MKLFEKYLEPLRDAEGGGGGGAADGSGGGTNGGGGNPWHHGVDAAILGHWQNKSYDLSDPGKIAIEATKGHLEAQSKLGIPANQLLRLPADASDEAGWKGVYAKLGVPADAKEYDFAAIKYANGNPLEESLVDTMRAALHGARVSKDRATDVIKAVVKLRDDASAGEGTERAAKLESERATLKRDWGNNYDFNHLKAMEGARRLGVDAAAIQQLEQQLGYSKVMEMFRKVGAGTSEDAFVEGARTRPDGLPATREGAAAMLKEKMADTEGWAKRLMAGDPQAKREFKDLTKLATGLTEEAA